MSEWIRKINWKYVVVMLIGNIILGLGIAIFKLSGLGNDPFSGMVMALSDRIGIDYPIFLIIVNHDHIFSGDYFRKKDDRSGNICKCLAFGICCFPLL